MQVCWLILLVSGFGCPLLTKSEIKPVLINKFELTYPGFSTILRTFTLNFTSWTLAISCFDPIPFTTDYVYTIPNIEQQLTTNITPTVLTNQITWPNGIVAADRLVEYSIIVPSGFLVPGKTNGNLYYISKEGPIALVPEDGTKWFYHDAAFKDMDNDGHIDIVAGRADVPLIGKSRTQLIWLKNPGQSTITGPWILNYLVLEGGPDIQVEFVQVDSLQVSLINFSKNFSIKCLYSRFCLLIHILHVSFKCIGQIPIYIGMILDNYMYVILIMNLFNMHIYN
jgi:hypothetical protein